MVYWSRPSMRNNVKSLMTSRLSDGSKTSSPLTDPPSSCCTSQKTENDTTVGSIGIGLDASRINTKGLTHRRTKARAKTWNMAVKRLPKCCARIVKGGSKDRFPAFRFPRSSVTFARVPSKNSVNGVFSVNAFRGSYFNHSSPACRKQHYSLDSSYTSSNRIFTDLCSWCLIGIACLM